MLLRQQKSNLEAALLQKDIQLLQQMSKFGGRGEEDDQVTNTRINEGDEGSADRVPGPQDQPVHLLTGPDIGEFSPRDEASEMGDVPSLSSRTVSVSPCSSGCETSSRMSLHPRSSTACLGQRLAGAEKAHKRLQRESSLSKVVIEHNN